MRELGDASSDGSSKFDESWPSTSEGGKRDGSPRGREGEVGVAQEVKVGVAPEVDVGVECHVGHHLTAEEKSANTTHDSTLGRYVVTISYAMPLVLRPAI